MDQLPASIPRAARAREISADSLAFLTRVHDAHGALAVIRDDGPVFSRAPDCPGVVAVFGAEHLRTVLGDLARFGMPVSAAQRLALPPPLVNLNRGLHSMIGDEHAAHRRLIGGVLGAAVAAYGDDLSAVLRGVTRGWRDGATLDMLDTMRDLATEVASRALLGAGQDGAQLGARLRSYFHLRRAVSSPAGAVPSDVETLVALGLVIDEALRAHVRRCRTGGGPRGIVADLATARTASGALLDEDAVVAHANVLFISGTEPIAVALTWILLVLSQRHALRRRIRAELAAGRRELLDDAIDEALRLVPPNALMVRVTTREAVVGGVTLPERCEIVVCPFVAHRDPARFPEPGRYLPSRWRTIRPSPFEYLPFGAGGHACIGKTLARHLLGRALAHILAHHDLTLADDQAIDWRVHILLMPSVDPVMAVRAADAPGDPGGRLHGPAAALLGPLDLTA
jgi:cytochrome P450